MNVAAYTGPDLRGILAKVMAEQAELARTGAEDPLPWHCGRCGERAHAFVRENPDVDCTGRLPDCCPNAPHPFDPYINLLICDCCSFDGCPHRQAEAVSA